MDNFKGLTVPAHMRGPAQAVNWVELTEDSEVNARMAEQLTTALGLIGDVLAELGAKIAANGLEADVSRFREEGGGGGMRQHRCFSPTFASYSPNKTARIYTCIPPAPLTLSLSYSQDADPGKALTQPRTMVSDRLGHLIVNRLKVRVRLDERRIGEILSGIDGASMGGDDAFTSAAGRIIGHLGDVMSLGFTPAGADASAPGVTAAGAPPAADRYLFHVESSDISRLRADVQSLGFQSTVTPGGAVRLVHAVVRAVMLAFKESPPEEVAAYRERMKGWYRLMTREALNVSVCVDTRGEVEGGAFMVQLSGKAEDAALRATSPLVMTNEIDLVPLGKAMRGDPPEAPKV